MPVVLAICDDVKTQEQIYRLSEKTKANFIVETDCSIILASLSMNFMSRSKDMYVGEARDKMWKKIDILFYEGDNPLEFLPALLSGVVVVNSIDDLESALSKPLDSLVRVSNYERGKAMLDNLLMV